MQVEILKNDNTFALDVEELIKKNKEIIFLIPESMRLDTLLGESGLSDEMLYRLNIAYQFSINAKLKHKPTNKYINANSIKDILQNIDKILTTEEYQLILEDIDPKKFSKVIQQFIYLNIDIDIVTREELKYLEIYKNYTREIESLKSKLSILKNSIDNYPNNSEVLESKKALSFRINKIEKYIQNSQERKLKISIMATKKTGKSVIINSFLEEEYAPTSLTLPTPNAIIYEGWDEKYIELKIEADSSIKGYEKAIIKKFDTARETREFVYGQFKKAQIDEENAHKLPDMYIRIPQKLEYLIIDTPGPDLAGADHSEIAEKWMRESDAIVFASDFSKHLTDGEIKFLKNVKLALAKYDKFHSLIFTINKIDMRYQDNENKSIVKFIDFFRRRLDEMGYGGIPVMATSALQYFDIFELKRVFKKYELEYSNDYKSLRDTIEDLDDEDEDRVTSEDKTINTFILESLTKLKRFHRIKNPTLDNLSSFSGMPFLINRVNYIAKTKANIEIFKYIFGEIDKELSGIKNEFLLKEIKRLQEQKDELLEDIDSVGKFFRATKKDVEIYFSNNTLTNEAKELLDYSYENINSKAIAGIETEIETIKEDSIMNEKSSIKVDTKNIISMVEPVLQEEITSLMSYINDTKNSYMDSMDSFIKETNRELISFIDSKKFKEKYNLDLSFPTLDPALKQSEFKIDWESVFDKNMFKQTETIDSESERDKTIDHGSGFLWFREIFGTRYETITESYFDEQKAMEGLNKVRDRLKSTLLQNIELAKYRSKEAMNKQLDDFAKRIKAQADSLVDSYIETNEWLRIHLDDDIDKVETKTKLLNALNTPFDEMDSVWKLIKDEK